MTATQPSTPGCSWLGRAASLHIGASVLGFVILATILGSTILGSKGAAQEAALPDTPTPQLDVVTAVHEDAQADASVSTSQNSSGRMDFRSAQVPCKVDPMSTATVPPMSCSPDVNPFQRFLNTQPIQPMTARQKLRLAAENVVAPFNLLTIAGDAALTIGVHPRSRYGPGMMGWAKYSGVSLTQDMTGEFFVTFLVPAVAHQDPRFHRIPNASYARRAAHCITHVVWAESDTGKPMPNYAYLIGLVAADTISNTYVPGRQQGTWPTASRVAVALGSAPIDNFITEFLPDVARHVSIRIVLVQRLINRVALTESPQE